MRYEAEILHASELYFEFLKFTRKFSDNVIIYDKNASFLVFKNKRKPKCLHANSVLLVFFNLINICSITLSLLKYDLSAFFS